MKNRISSASMDVRAAAPYSSVDDFLTAMQQDYPTLSRQLKSIARYVDQSRHQLALEGIQETARHCEVQPSAVIRFAKHFGFSGFSEMQALFRAGAARQLAPNRDYEERFRYLAGAGPSLSAAHIAHDVIDGSIDSLQALQRALPAAQFEAALDLMLDAPSLWLVASRRAFPVAAYLAYALQHTAKPVHWLHGLGYMQHGQLSAVVPGDLLLAVSFEPYAQETLAVVDSALVRGAKLLAITDTKLSPLVAKASVTLLVQDGTTFGFRSLTSTLALAQSLFLGLAHRMELAYEHKTPP